MDGHREGNVVGAEAPPSPPELPPLLPPRGSSLWGSQASTAARVVDGRPDAMVSTGAGGSGERRGRHGDRRTVDQLGQRLVLLEAVLGWWLAVSPDYAEHMPCCPSSLGYTVDGAVDCWCPERWSDDDTAAAGQPLSHHQLRLV